MPTGVIVIDQHKHPYRHNQQAERLLGCYTIPSNISPQLHHFSQELAELHDRWCQGEALESASFLVPSNQRMLHPRWVALHHGHRDQGAVIYLEDMGEIKAHAQRMKLAALGRLTANIAHEIRNPLSSIRYAAELLHEQHLPETPNHHLTRIMVQNVQRINHIIEEVMQLNHRDKAKGEHILLAPLISKLIQEKIDTQILPANAISFSIPENLDIWCDPFHVERVLWNLISNAWRHSQQQHGSVKIHARFGYTEEVSIIDINDDGHGISPDYQRHLFEPFATTHKQGNGLGLYIARELTEANHGTLEYIHDEKKEAPHTGAHFRVILPRHPLYTTLPDVD
jgi:two-component system sensor histidine kinase PilS (NtrC family)